MTEASENPNINAFLHSNRVAVLATADKQTSTPHAAAVYYATDSHLNIYFLTKSNTLKNKNLEVNPRAAMVIYEQNSQRTAQIHGQIYKVTEPKMMEKAKVLMSRFAEQTAGTKLTPIEKLNAGEYILYRLEPQSIRLGDYKYGTPTTMFDLATPAEESLE